ncbi:MAG TPA: tail fiber domain-containing protein, partial [Vicinamibacterales bacterium]
ISTWQYKSDPESVRHMGPMAQDFQQAFGLGDSDRWYHTVDGHGVALASIQALAKLAAEQREHLEALRRQNAVLERRLRALERK